MTARAARLAACLLPLCLLLAGPAAAAPGWRDLPYAEVVELPLKMGALDPGGVFRYSYTAKPGKGHAALPAGLKFQVRTGGQVVPLPLGPEGRLEVPVRRDWAESGALVQVNQPKGRVALSINFEPRVPPGTRMSYATLAESAPVMERGIKEMAGLMSFMAPKVKSLALRFAGTGAQTATLLHPDGKRQVFRTDAKGVLTLPWNRAWSAATVELSAPLQKLGPVMK